MNIELSEKEYRAIKMALEVGVVKFLESESTRTKTFADLWDTDEEEMMDFFRIVEFLERQAELEGY